MKVILLVDIKGVGKKGQVYEASDGYARNFLFPKKKAVEATKANMNELALKQKSIENKAKQELDDAMAMAKKLEATTIKIPVKTGDKGRLFGSVTSKEVASALLEQENLTIDRKKITLPEAIKSIGTAKAEVKLHSQVSAKITIEVIEG